MSICLCWLLVVSVFMLMCSRVFLLNVVCVRAFCLLSPCMVGLVCSVCFYVFPFVVVCVCLVLLVDRLLLRFLSMFACFREVLFVSICPR